MLEKEAKKINSEDEEEGKEETGEVSPEIEGKIAAKEIVNSSPLNQPPVEDFTEKVEEDQNEPENP